MTEPGERRPPGTTAPVIDSPGGADRLRQLRARSPAIAIALAIAVALLAALAWALLRGVLELGIGLLAVAALGGWSVGAMLRQMHRAAGLAAAIAAGGWFVGLLLTWLVSMAILPGSTRTFLGRVEGTPFLDWLSPQFGLLEVAALVVWVSAAAYAARPSVRPAS